MARRQLVYLQLHISDKMEVEKRKQPNASRQQILIASRSPE
jgi:hypothetical protein